MNKKKLLLSLLVISLVLASNAYALETQYPEIMGKSITEETTPAGYVVYFFYLAIALGSVLVFIVLVLAGVDFMTAGGEPAKISEAKKKVTSAIIGLVVLLSSFLILNSINPDLLNIELGQLECPSGIGIVKRTALGKIANDCISSDMKNIEGEIIETKGWKFSGCSIKEVYLCSQPDFKGTCLKVSDERSQDYTCQPNYQFTDNTSLSGVKSIKFVWRSPGLYLYDSTGMQAQDITKSPKYLVSSVKNMNSLEFDNAAQSSQFIWPATETAGEDDTYYGAVFFDSINYSGRCSLEIMNREDLGEPNSIGRNTLSSVVLFTQNQVSESKDLGDIVFYNNIDCGQSTAEEVKTCKLDINNYVTAGKIKDACPNFKDGDYVLSFSLSGPGGLVLKGNQNNLCEYFDVGSLTSGSCYSSLKTKSTIYVQGPSGVKPESYIIFPVGNK